MLDPCAFEIVEIFLDLRLSLSFAGSFIGNLTVPDGFRITLDRRAEYSVLMSLSSKLISCEKPKTLP